MSTLEDIVKGKYLKGIIPNQIVEVIDAVWHGDDVIEVTFKDSLGNPNNEILYRDNEVNLEIVTSSAPWSFSASSDKFKLVSEAYRIKLAYVFDPMMAIHTSMIEPLPHQITAVYDNMLPRQPLRYVLADDPGSGKTIMAGLLIKELAIRGDVKRCLIVCPGVLAEQWQDELFQKFQLPFEKKIVDKLNDYNFTLYTPEGEKEGDKNFIIIDILNLTYSITSIENPEIRSIDTSKLKHIMENL